MFIPIFILTGEQIQLLPVAKWVRGPCGPIRKVQFPIDSYPANPRKVWHGTCVWPDLGGSEVTSIESINEELIDLLGRICKSNYYNVTSFLHSSLFITICNWYPSIPLSKIWNNIYPAWHVQSWHPAQLLRLYSTGDIVFNQELEGRCICTPTWNSLCRRAPWACSI